MPIHYTMHAKQCNDRDDEYVDILKVLILKADGFIVDNNTPFNR